MENSKPTFKDIWHSAALYGLWFAAISTAYMLISTPLQKMVGESAGKVLIFVLDAAKILACIKLMSYCFRQFLENWEDAGVPELRRLGTMTGLLSALIFAAANMAYYMYNPELVTEIMKEYEGVMGGNIDSNTRMALTMMEENFPRIAFFGQLIYCFLWGWVLSAILAPRAMLSKMLDDTMEKMIQKPEEDEEDVDEQDGEDDDEEDIDENDDAYIEKKGKDGDENDESKN